MAKFVLSDEAVVNSYGFRIPTKGINLKRFKANPVMLDQHYNSTSAVLGRWKNVAVEDNGQLTAEDDFDTEDETANKVKGKVDRGFIKGASIGITFSREAMQKAPDGVWELSKCELYEASIVAIPSNSNSLRLFASETGELLTEDEIKLTLSALSTEPIIQNNTEMKKLNLSAITLMALGLANADDIDAVTLAVEKLTANYNAEKTARAALQAEMENIQNAQALALVDDAITTGKLTADVKDEFVNMAKANYKLAVKVIGAMPAKQSLSNKVQNTATGEVKSMDDFQALTLTEQLAWKAANPAAYKQMFS